MRLRRSRPKRKGAVLLAVLMVVVLLALAAYQFSNSMLAEYRAADSFSRAAQARAFADSGLHYTAALLATPDAIAANLNGNPWSNSTAFRGVLVADSDNPKRRGLFSVIAPLGPDDPGDDGQPFRYGVTDETGKLNLNALMKLDSSGKIAHDVLINLPNMSEDVVNAILDWLDPDESPRSNGAENEYYLTLDTPYRAKNGPLDSLEELLYVKGVTPQLLFGNDRNRNGILDPDEDDGTGGLDFGWSAYLTVYSREQNIDSAGQPRIWLNDPNLDTLLTNLTDAGIDQNLASFIYYYRLNGGSQQSQSSQGGSQNGSSNTSQGSSSSSGSGSGSSTGGSSGATAPTGNIPVPPRNPNARPRANIASVFDLVGARVQIQMQQGQNTQSVTIQSPLTNTSQLRQLLPLLLDKTTTTQDAELPARVNVTTAPAAVLAALPGLDSADVQTILAKRPSLTAAEPVDDIYQAPAWLLTEANLPREKVAALERYVTARSQVYRVQVIGYFEGGGPTARLEAVIDASGGKPRIAYWRDLTELGRGFNLGNQP